MSVSCFYKKFMTKNVSKDDGFVLSKKGKSDIISVIFLCMFQQDHATIYDDRFIPLFVPQQFFIEGLPSAYELDFVAITASEAFARDEKTVGIPELFGTFDLNTLATSLLEITGKTPLRSDLLGRELPFFVNGRIQGEGF